MEKKDLKLPPQDLEAEQSVLGAIMMDKEALGSVADTLNADDFYDRRNGTIYEVMLSLWEKRAPIDILSVSAELKKGDVISTVGGPGYLTDLVNSVPSAAHIAYYASIVKEKKILRELISTSNNITQSAMEQTDDLEVLLDNIEQKVFSITNKSAVRNFVQIKDEIPLLLDRMEKMSLHGNSIRGVPTGFAHMDSLLSGFQKSDLIILGARPSFGKTSLALDIARNVATRANMGVGIFSLEMSKEQITDRLVSAEARVGLWKLRTGNIKDPVDYEMMQAAFDRLSRAPLYIDDTPSPNILEIRRMARRLQAEQKDLSLIVIDYLQLIQPRKNSDNPVQQITEISRGLKTIARELNVPILALSQLSRGVEQRDNKVPKLSDLRDSGSIEQDADIVMFLHPAWRYMNTAELPPDQDGLTEIHIAKHRNGPLGIISLRFNKDSASFENIDTIHEDTGAY
ncbi:MAG: replicative DNA helicase [Candidatus Colwellbacteria bacterium]|nr:replicative DNA helicase [Candidatus Colwellbacteria bacterium]